MAINNVTYLTLEGHFDLENYKYIYFVITLTVYISIIVFNISVIFIVMMNKHLHEPMYIFIAALLCNSLFGTITLYPKLLSDLLSEKQVISFGACLFQAFCLYTYALSEFALLSVMAYDRYVSICNPLHYTTLIKMSTVKKLIFISWACPCCEIAIAAVIIYHLRLCTYKINKIYCDGYSIVKLSCKETSVMYIYGFSMFVIAAFPPVIFVTFSYTRILSVCLRNSKDFRRKALQTCLPHFLIFITFSISFSFEIVNNRLGSNQIPHIVAMILSVQFLLIPPLFNPIIYGLKMQEILKSIKRLILWKKITIGSV